MINGFGKNGHKSFFHSVTTGAGLALGAVITLGLIKIVTNATGIGHEFSYTGWASTQNTLSPAAWGQGVPQTFSLY